MAYVKREVEGRIKELWELFPSVFIVGPRRSGKTTLVKKLAEEYGANYVSLDDPDALDLFNRDIKLFSKKYLGDVNVIDEIQYGEDPGRKLKYLIDLEGKRFLVTGSSARAISSEVLSFLVGRAAIVNLYPFSIKEAARAEGSGDFLGDREWSRLVNESLLFGLFPEVVLSDKKEEVRNLLVNALIQKEVPYLEGVNSKDVYMVAKALAYLSSLLNYSTLSDMTKLSYHTVRRVVNAFEEAFVIKLVGQYPEKPSNLRKRPKVYFTDPGIYAYLRRLNEPDGRSMEHLVFSELLKMGKDPLFWRSKDGAEVDFVVDDIPVEVKIRAPERKVSRSFRSFVKRFNPEKGIIVDTEPGEWEIEVEETTVLKVPVWKLRDVLQ